jgi:sec-independent protein translocase protein TatA
MVGIFQPWHLIVVLVIVMMVFGPGKLPELGKAIGDGLRELKKATSGEEDKGAA